MYIPTGTNTASAVRHALTVEHIMCQHTRIVCWTVYSLVWCCILILQPATCADVLRQNRLHVCHACAYVATFRRGPSDDACLLCKCEASVYERTTPRRDTLKWLHLTIGCFVDDVLGTIMARQGTSIRVMAINATHSHELMISWAACISSWGTAIDLVRTGSLCSNSAGRKMIINIAASTSVMW